MSSGVQRFKVISRRCSMAQADLAQFRLEHARISCLVESFEAARFDGAELVIALNAGRMRIDRRERFEVEIERATELLDMVIPTVGATSTQPPPGDVQ